MQELPWSEGLFAHESHISPRKFIIHLSGELFKIFYCSGILHLSDKCAVLSEFTQTGTV